VNDERTQVSENAPVAEGFDDLLAANRGYADSFDMVGFDGVAHAGVAIVTCMDSRIDPLGLVGLRPGDAKIFRNPGGRVTDAALEALVLGTHLLNVNRVLVIPHTRCAVASNSEEELRDKVGASAGKDASWMSFGVIEDQARMLRADVARVRSHPLIAEGTLVGGFIYDVDSGLLQPVV
jgi:carbonic anhydrase